MQTFVIEQYIFIIVQKKHLRKLKVKYYENSKEKTNRKKDDQIHREIV
mgnify:CR=1 FL=1